MIATPFKGRMMKEHLVNNLADSARRSQPHFDDERTLLTARPVVPLKKLEAKARHRRQWVLGGAFAVAMMLGAASALVVASYLKPRAVAQTATELSFEPEVAPAPVAIAANQTTDSTVVSEEPEDETEHVEETTTPIPPKQESPAKHRVAISKPNPEPVVEPDADDMSDDEQSERMRDAELYDEWQERRARRAQRRERRRAERYNHRDLSNLNEIFEGRRP